MLSTPVQSGTVGPNLQADDHVQQQAVEQLKQLVIQLDQPTAMATLAWQLRNKLGTNFDAGWFGFGNFKALLMHAVPDVKLESSPQGLIFPAHYERLKTTLNVTVQVPEGVPSIAAQIKQLDKSFPTIARDGMLNVYQYLQEAMLAVSEQVAPNIQYVNLVSKRARALISDADIPPVPRSALDFVMKALLYTGALTAIPTSDEIGQRYCESTIARAKSLLGEISSIDETSLREWLLPSQRD